MNKLSDFDKNILLLVFGLTVSVVALATGLEMFGVISQNFAWTMDLMAVAWWFGAVMTFGYERVKKRIFR